MSRDRKSWGDDDDEGPSSRGPKSIREFDCPSCNASNPLGDPAAERDEVMCNYCGSEYVVSFNSEGRPRLKER